MTITLYEAPMSSATPVVWAMLELQAPLERKTLKLSDQVHKQPWFLELNPNGKVPTLVVDGTPMFEAVAIMQWLGDKFGAAKNLWPAFDAPDRLTALSWSTWAYVTYGAATSRLTLSQGPRVSPELHNPAQAAAAGKEIQHLLSLVDARLAHRKYLLNDNFSLVDLIVVSAVTYGTYCGASVDAHPNIQVWMARCHDRPAFRTAWGQE